MNKTIAIVANTTWNIYNFRLNLIKKLIDENWSVTVIAPFDEYIEYKEKYPQVKHVLLKSLERDGKNPLKDLRLLWELRNIYKKHKPELVLHYTHKPNIYGGFAAKLSGVRSMAVITGLGYAFIHNSLTTTITKWLYKLVSPFHSKFIFENEDDKDLFIKNGIVKKENAISVNGCGVDTAIFLPYPNGKPKPKIIFTFIGRLLYDKGIAEFVKAAKNILSQRKDVEFWVVGELDKDNPSRVKKDELLEWIDEKVIVYHGFVRDVRPIIAKSDCIVLPSYREGMPRIVLEGMSMAKPIITTNTPGCRQTINPGINGYLVEVGNVEDLTNKMQEFLRLDHEAAHQMGARGREYAIADFNSQKIAKDLFDIVSQA